MRNPTLWVLIVAGLLLAGAFAIQHQSTRRLAAELTSIRQEIAAAPAQPEERNETRRARLAPSSNAAILQRLTALEESVAQLARNSDYLMDRGQLPLAGNKLNDLFAKFADPAASDRDRLQELRLMRRTGGISEDAVLQAIDWVKTAT